MMRRFACAGLLLSGTLVAGCPKPNPGEATDSGTVAVTLDAAPAKPEAGGVELSEADPSVKPVYPIDPKAAPNPLAQRLCAALHDAPEAKRAACCSQTPGTVFTSECTRTLSAAMTAKATTLAPADIDACAAAIDTTYAGCEWPGPFPPELPPACQGLIKGTLTAGTRCRSTLECEGTLRCHGVGPTTTGRCGDPHADGGKCGGAVDSLASYTRQNDVDAKHPECTGYCDRGKCAALLPLGTKCKNGFQCGDGKLCVNDKCAVAAAGKLGDPCPGGACEPGILCIANKCVAKKATGAECKMDFECMGGCIKSDAGKNTCGKKCDLR